MGFVPDIQTILGGDGALVVAVRVGGGARTKILEALACGMPVVSTSIGVENLNLVSGRDFLLAETAAEMTDALLRLNRDAELVASLAREGVRRAEVFRWSEIEKTVESVYQDVMSRSGRVQAIAPATAVLPNDTMARRMKAAARRQVENKRRPGALENVRIEFMEITRPIGMEARRARQRAGVPE